MNSYTETLRKFVLDSVRASVPVDIVLATYRDGAVELAPCEYVPCLVLDHVKELHNGDTVVYARTSGVRKYIVLGKVNG